MENEERLGKLSSTMRKALEKIIARCEKAGIEYKWGMGFFEKYELLVYIQGGTGKRAINIYDAESAHELLDSDFEKYVFVEGYEAICCYEEKFVEEVIGSIRSGGSKEMILSRLKPMG